MKKVMELPGVHMHWADRWGLREQDRVTQLDMIGPIILDVPVGWSETVAAGTTTTGYYGVSASEPEPDPPTWSKVSISVPVGKPTGLSANQLLPDPQPWFIFRCRVCEYDIPFYLTIDMAEVNPFQVTVIATQCENCASRWAAVLPPVRVMEADKLNLREVDIIDGSTD
jgi:hypothetical protein